MSRSSGNALVTSTVMKFARCVWLATVFACAFHAALSCAAMPLALRELDSLVEQQNYGVALQRLNDSRVSEEDKIDWLRSHAEVGHVPLQYELAALLLPRDRAESLKWYARGRLARTLDAAECTIPGASYGGRVGLDGRGSDVRDAGVADPKGFQRAIEEALEWDEKRSNVPSAKWICGEATTGAGGPMKPENERRAARNEARHNMRVAAKTIADFELAVERGAQAKYKLVESGILVVPRYGSDRWAGWLDNRRVLFVGFPPGTTAIPLAPGKSHGTGAVVLLWDTEQNRIDVFLRPAFVGELCVDGNHVVIVTGTEDESTVVFEGNYPSLSFRKVERRTQVFPILRPDCKPAQPVVGQRKAFEYSWLRDGHGYIERPRRLVSSDGEYLFARFHRPDGMVTELPVTARGAVPIAYAPWKNAYLLQGESRPPRTTRFRLPGDRRRGDDAVLFWLYTDGRTEPIVIPYGQWDMKNSPSPFYRPTRRGLLLAGGYSDNDNEPGFAGLYLFEGAGEVTRLVAGPANVAAVSPDGCRVAFAHAPNRAGLREYVDVPLDPRLRQSMKIIDVCQGN